MLLLNRPDEGFAPNRVLVAGAEVSPGAGAEVVVAGAPPNKLLAGLLPSLPDDFPNNDIYL